MPDTVQSYYSSVGSELTVNLKNDIKALIGSLEDEIGISLLYTSDEELDYGKIKESIMPQDGKIYILWNIIKILRSKGLNWNDPSYVYEVAKRIHLEFKNLPSDYGVNPYSKYRGSRSDVYMDVENNNDRNNSLALEYIKNTGIAFHNDFLLWLQKFNIEDNIFHKKEMKRRNSAVARIKSNSYSKSATEGQINDLRLIQNHIDSINEMLDKIRFYNFVDSLSDTLTSTLSSNSKINSLYHIISNTESQIIENDADEEEDNKDNAEVFDEYMMDDSENHSEIKFAINTLDDYVRVKKGNFILIAARPASGKSAFSLRTALLNSVPSEALDYVPTAEQKKEAVYVKDENGKWRISRRTLMVNFEMTRQQVSSRILGWLGSMLAQNKSVEEIRHLYKNDSKFREMFLENIKELNIDNKYNLSRDLNEFLEQLKVLVKAAKNEGRPYTCIVVDHIQNIHLATGTKWDAISEAADKLKFFARENNIVLIACCQLNRDADDSKLSMNQMFGSSSLEQYADIILGLEKKATDNDDGLTNFNISILKNRDGRPKDDPIRTKISFEKLTIKEEDN